MINVDGKTLILEENKIELDYNIRKFIEFSTQIIVLVYDDIIIPNNVIAFDKQGNMLWSINDILKIKKTTGNVDISMTDNGYLNVYSSLGIVFCIDVEERSLIEKKYLR